MAVEVRELVDQEPHIRSRLWEVYDDGELVGEVLKSYRDGHYYGLPVDGGSSVAEGDDRDRVAEDLALAVRERKRRTG